MAQSTHIPREMLSSKIKDLILGLILEGELQPGDRLVETKISREYGVSQSPTREAIRDLAAAGLLEVEPYRGARVRRFTKDDFLDYMEVRGELEAIAARRAAVRIDRSQIERMRALLTEMHELGEAADAHGQALRNTEFHRIVIRAAGSEVLERIWTMLEPFARTYVTAMVPGADLIWLGDRHLAILEALENGDAEQAASVMRHHADEARGLIEHAEIGGLGPEEAEGVG